MQSKNEKLEELAQVLYRLDPSVPLERHRDSLRQMLTRYGASENWSPPQDTGFGDEREGSSPVGPESHLGLILVFLFGGAFWVGVGLWIMGELAHGLQ